MRVTPNLDTINTFEICNPSDPGLIQTDPAIVFNGQNYVVVWADEKNSTADVYRITTTRVTPQGVVLDTGIRISTGTGTSESRPNIAYDGNRSLVVWYKSSTGIYGRFINNNGQPEGSVITIATGSTGGPNLAFGDTNYLAVWFIGAYPNLEIVGRLISRQGVLIGNVINIAMGSGCRRWADVKFDGTKYLVVWQTGDNNAGQIIYGQFISKNGTLVGSNFIISNNTNTQRWWPALAVSDSNFLVTWQQGTITDIYGNVDITTSGIEETGQSIYNARPIQTIFSRNLKFINDKQYVVYDVTGKQVTASQLKQGIYFIKDENQLRIKLILMK